MIYSEMDKKDDGRNIAKHITIIPEDFLKSEYIDNFKYVMA